MADWPAARRRMAEDPGIPLSMSSKLQTANNGQYDWDKQWLLQLCWIQHPLFSAHHCFAFCVFSPLQFFHFSMELMENKEV
jgi:hypothetical protein